jgi:hypothetical protein
VVRPSIEEEEEMTDPAPSKVKVVVRIRPFVAKEVNKRCVVVSEKSSIELRQSAHAPALSYGYIPFRWVPITIMDLTNLPLAKHLVALMERTIPIRSRKICSRMKLSP